MLAGDAISAATTLPPSPSRSGAKRSTMRYWTWLASGTRRLGHQLVDHGERRRVVPLALAVPLVAHAPARIHDESHRQAADLPAARRLLVAIEDDRQLDELPFQE